MLKLTQSRPGPGQIEIRIDGRLAANCLPQLVDLLESTELGPSDLLIIDLSGVTSLDTEATRFLLGLRADGWGYAGACRLHGGSLYVNSLLQEVRS